MMYESIPTTRTDTPKEHPQEDKLGFGDVFTDHMLLMDYMPAQGWNNPRIEPYRAIELEPAAMIFHYAQSVFEGIKCFRSSEGRIHLFRPHEYAKRFARSCERLCIPPIDPGLVLHCIKELVRVDSSWVPISFGTSLYVRPFIIATDNHLGVRSSETFLFMIILSPVGSYYAEGFNPVSITVSDKFVRAVKGGTGAAKTAGNYAASLLASAKAKEEGYTQVLWLDGNEMKYVDEVGTMNIFFVLDGNLVTPPLGGTILNGVTRNSVIQLAEEWGVKVEERKIPIEEIMEAGNHGTLTEVFGSGTAAVISPVGKLRYKGKVININGGKVGEFSKRLFDEITGIQYGKIADRFGWNLEVS
jgi:branched-chain amino acid aminotransferase